MKIMVAGGSGFLGSHVADALTAAGHDVTIYDRVKSPWLQAKQKMVVGDILDRDAVNAACAGCTAVYNFAGVADIDEAADDPTGVITANVVGTAHLLAAARAAGSQRFVFASSIYVYSDMGSFYRCSKQAGELLVEEYQQRYGLNYTILRYGSVYGPRSDDRNWVRAMLREALATGAISRNGDGNELREYIHASDAAQSSVAALAPEYANQPLILTGGSAIRIADLLTMVQEMLAPHRQVKVSYLPAVGAAHYEITPYVFKPRLARKLVANPHIDLGQGLLDLLHELNEVAG